MYQQATLITIRTNSLIRVNGGDTQLIYLSPDKTETKIVDNSVENFDGTINVSAGETIVKFIGESAVYDFDIEFERIDGVSFSDL